MDGRAHLCQDLVPQLAAITGLYLQDPYGAYTARAITLPEMLWIVTDLSLQRLSGSVIGTSPRPVPMQIDRTIRHPEYSSLTMASLG